jgi:hypothetical protein
MKRQIIIYIIIIMFLIFGVNKLINSYSIIEGYGGGVNCGFGGRGFGLRGFYGGGGGGIGCPRRGLCI